MVGAKQIQNSKRWDYFISFQVINGPPTTGHLYASQPRMDGVSWRTVLYRSSGQTISITVDLGNYDDSVYHYAGFSVTYWPSSTVYYISPLNFLIFNLLH